jgi:hypothetical protein
VLVKKSNGDWRICIDYTDLNKECPKDPFPLPSIDSLVDATSGFKYLCFMEALSGYNQIKMYQGNEGKQPSLSIRVYFAIELCHLV